MKTCQRKMPSARPLPGRGNRGVTTLLNIAQKRPQELPIIIVRGQVIELQVDAALALRAGTSRLRK